MQGKRTQAGRCGRVGTDACRIRVHRQAGVCGGRNRGMQDKGTQAGRVSGGDRGMQDKYSGECRIKAIKDKASGIFVCRTSDF